MTTMTTRDIIDVVVTFPRDALVRPCLPLLLLLLFLLSFSPSIDLSFMLLVVMNSQYALVVVDDDECLFSVIVVLSRR